jgi:NADH:ubiquinone oxidoreductase subunit
MTFGTWLFTKMRGELVGTDPDGNRYFQEKRIVGGRRRKRWVMYDGEAEASRVPPDWHGWLHYTTDTPPPEGGSPRRPWQKEHLPNLSGTEFAYHPPGSAVIDSRDSKPKPAYEAWRPS